MASDDELIQGMEQVSRACLTDQERRFVVEAIAEVRELRKDKARLDWILERSVGYPVIAGQKTPAFDRGAIDAAIGGEG